MPSPVEQLESAIQSAINNVLSLFKRVFGEAPKANLAAIAKELDQMNGQYCEKNYALGKGAKPADDNDYTPPSRRM